MSIIKMKIIENNKIKWIDIIKPKDEDIKFLEDNFQFHHLLLEEARSPTYHPLVESYEFYLFLILHFPNFYKKLSRVQSIEVDFLITNNTLITIRYHDFVDFDEIFTEVANNPVQYLDKTTGHLFHHLIKGLFHRMFPELDKIKESIDDIEDSIFEDFNKDSIEQIAHIKRQILDFIRALKPQKSVWHLIPAITIKFWGERLRPYVSDLIADYNRMLHFVETHREVADSLHLTSSSLLDNRRNYVIKVLTVFTAILLPLTFVTSIYGMNLRYLPLAEHPMAFWIFIGSMTAATLTALAWLKWHEWL